MNQQWPEEDTQVVNCPNCSHPCKLDLELVRQQSLPVRPAYCVSCDAEFELNIDGTTKLMFAYPKERGVDADRLIMKLSGIDFDPR
jgi:DNA-directed RNA polymerase subunit RPC12/RpoP